MACSPPGERSSHGGAPAIAGPMSSQLLTILRFTAKCPRPNTADWMRYWPSLVRCTTLSSNRWKGTYAWWREHNPGEEQGAPGSQRSSRSEVLRS